MPPVFAPGILIAISAIWVAFCALFRKFAKVQFPVTSGKKIVLESVCKNW